MRGVPPASCIAGSCAVPRLHDTATVRVCSLFFASFSHTSLFVKRFIYDGMTQSVLIPDRLMVGCWQLDDRSWTPLLEKDVSRAIDTYLALGIRSFDTADIYGRSERLLGQILKGQSCKIFTKAVFFGTIPTPHQIRNKVESALRNLQRDRLDCVQIHWHDPQSDFGPTLSAFADLVEQGKICQLGVTNFNTPMMERAIQYAPIHTHQVQYSLIDRRVEQSMQSLCLKHKIGILAYGPLAGGFLSDQFRGVSYPPTEPDHARSFYYSNMIRTHGGWTAVLNLLSTLAEVAQKYNKTTAQVALNWVSQQPGVTAVISGLTLNRQHIQQNVEALKFELAPEDLQLLRDRSDALLKQPGDIYSYER